MTNKKPLKKELEEMLTQVRKDRDEVEDLLERRRRELSELLYGKEHYSDKKGWSEIISKVSYLKGIEKREGQLLPMIDHTIKEENSKLWYLIRIVLKDPKIEEPMDFNRNESRFKRPDFN